MILVTWQQPFPLFELPRRELGSKCTFWQHFLKDLLTKNGKHHSITQVLNNNTRRFHAFMKNNDKNEFQNVPENRYFGFENNIKCSTTDRFILYIDDYSNKKNTTRKARFALKKIFLLISHQFSMGDRFK